MQQCLRSLVLAHMARANTSHMTWMHTQPGGDHNPCYTSTKMGMVTGRSGSMEMAAVSSLHDLLHITVFHIIGMATQGKAKTSHMASAYIINGVGTIIHATPAPKWVW